MRVIAGPSGAGKSSLFPLAELGIAFFNVDDRCAELNGGSYRGISEQVRTQANRECEDFIEEHVRTGRSFAVETTLRKEITFRQAAAARSRGFACYLEYVAAGSVETHIERVAARADAGGHAAPVERLRQIYQASMGHLPRALREFDRVDVYDDSGDAPDLVLEVHHGHVLYAAEPAPAWLRAALPGTEYELEDRR